MAVAHSGSGRRIGGGSLTTTIGSATCAATGTSSGACGAIGPIARPRIGHVSVATSILPVASGAIAGLARSLAHGETPCHLFTFCNKVLLLQVLGSQVSGRQHVPWTWPLKTCQVTFLWVPGPQVVERPQMWSPCPRALCRNTHPPLAKKMNILSHRWWEACIGRGEGRGRQGEGRGKAEGRQGGGCGSWFHSPFPGLSNLLCPLGQFGGIPPPQSFDAAP